MNLSSHWNC